MKTELTPIEIEEIGQEIREMQIQQTLNGLKLMPHMLPGVKEMANRGDDVMKEVLRRFKS